MRLRVAVVRDGGWVDDCGRPLGLGGAVHVLGGCAAVLPILHGPGGEDGTLAALCELAGVAYLGSGVGAGALGMDKWATKLVAGAVGIATAPGCLLSEATAASYVWTRPVVVKPVAAGSSHGVSLVSSPDGLAPALAAALALDGPALLDDDERDCLEHAAVRMYDALGCAGVARVDFFLTDEGPLLNEVNTMPGFTEQSQVPKMFAAAGTSYPDLLDLLVRDVLVTDDPAGRGSIAGSRAHPPAGGPAIATLTAVPLSPAGVLA